MNNLSQEIDNILKEEIALKNPKINGAILLEIIKYKIIDKLRDDKAKFNLSKIEDFNFQSTFENEKYIISIKSSLIDSQIVNLSTEVRNDLLIICIKELIMIDIEDFKTKKIFNYKCAPISGIVITKGTKCNVNYSKNSLILELFLEDKKPNIEKIEESTI